jgi:uncharacterized coiled-coil DUF342 family protein
MKPKDYEEEKLYTKETLELIKEGMQIYEKTDEYKANMPTKELKEEYLKLGTILIQSKCLDKEVEKDDIETLCVLAENCPDRTLMQNSIDEMKEILKETGILTPRFKA